MYLMKEMKKWLNKNKTENVSEMCIQTEWKEKQTCTNGEVTVKGRNKTLNHP